MFLKLFIIFAVMPIAEIALLLNVGEMIGGWETLAIVIITAFIGAKLVRGQGIATLHEIRVKSAHGEVPAENLVEGLMLLVAGVLLVTPGFITDAIGFLLSIPATRKPIALAVMQGMKDKVNVQGGFGGGFGQQSLFGQSPFEQAQPQKDPFERDPYAAARQPRVDQADQSRAGNGNGNVIDGEYQRKE